MKCLKFILFIFFLVFSQQIRFRDVASELGINVSGGLGATCLFFDYNDDNYLDILFDPGGRIYLFKNNYGLSFINVTDTARLSNYQFKSVVAGDFNNDGYLDILATNSGAEVYLFRNNGDGTFSEVADSLGISLGGYVALFFDYNLDGYLDILTVGNQSRLYKQMRSGFQLVTTFEDGNNALVFDYNNDFYPDIYLLRDGENKLYRNNGNGTFTDVTSEANVGNLGNSQTAAAGDFNNDGYLDIYLTNIGGGRNCLYENQRNGTFLDRTNFYGVGDVGDGRTCIFIDFNNDRLLDIFTTNHVYLNRLYKNMGYSAPFFNVAGQVNIATPSDVFVSSWGDFDNDGDLDAFLTGHFGNGYALMRDSGGNYFHYLKVKLVGRQSNKAGIGTKLYLYRNDTTQLVEPSSISLIAHFGLGNSPYFDSLIVLWPSGERNSFYFGVGDTLLTIEEPLSVIKEEKKEKPKEKFPFFDIQGRKIKGLNQKGIFFLINKRKNIIIRR
jgi:hypothetical protein